MSTKYTVLAADDSMLTRRFVQRSLEGSEFDLVATAKTGREAVDIFRQKRPDLVLLDIVMPELTGKEALNEILGVDPRAIVLMVSSLGTEDAIQECLSMGAKRFIQKPYSAEDLLMAMRDLMKS